MFVPLAARSFDGVVLTAPDALRCRYNLIDLPVADVLAALRHDRDRIATFETEARSAALGIADYLTIVRQDLVLIERQTRTFAALTFIERPYPPSEWPACARRRLADRRRGRVSGKAHYPGNEVSREAAWCASSASEETPHASKSHAAR